MDQRRRFTCAPTRDAAGSSLWTFLLFRLVKLSVYGKCFSTDTIAGIDVMPFPRKPSMVRKSLNFFLPVIAIVLLSANYCFADMFAIGPWPNSSVGPPENLYRINPATGAATLIAATGAAQLQGITSGISGDLIGTDGPHLYSINPGTANTTLIANLPFNSGEGDIARQPGTSTVYIMNSGNFDGAPAGLFKYNLSTGTGGFVGSFFPETPDISAGAFAPNGVLYILHDAIVGQDWEIATVNLTSGAATNILNPGNINPLVGGAGVAGMAFDASGMGFFTTGSELYSFDPMSLSVQLIGSTGAQRLSGLAIVAVPEPNSLFLVLGAAAVAVFFPIRKQCKCPSCLPDISQFALSRSGLVRQGNQSQPYIDTDATECET